MSKVKVTASKTGANTVVGVSSNNSEYGYIRVESSVSEFKGGWLNKVTRSAIIAGKTADLRSLNYQIGQEMPGKIVVKESLIPFYEGQQPKKNGSDATAVVLFKRVEGVDKPIYRQAQYTEDLTAMDELIQHDNVLSASARVMVQNSEAEKIG